MPVIKTIVENGITSHSDFARIVLLQMASCEECQFPALGEENDLTPDKTKKRNEMMMAAKHFAKKVTEHEEAEHQEKADSDARALEAQFKQQVQDTETQEQGEAVVQGPQAAGPIAEDPASQPSPEIANSAPYDEGALSSFGAFLAAFFAAASSCFSRVTRHLSRAISYMAWYCPSLAD